MSAPRAASRAGARRAPRAGRRGAEAPAHAVLAELEQLRERGASSGTLRLPGGHALAVSNLRKVFFPRHGYTKGDVMHYYARVAPQLLPALADRPLVLRRFPHGIEGKAFYQQRAPAAPPPGVRVELVADEGLTTQPRLVGGDLATLLYLVQLGAISTDPWHSRVPRVDLADYAIVDLDPGPRAPFRRVVHVARLVREVLDELRLHAVPKTSGATGLHVVLPLPAGTSNESARLLAQLVATRVAQRDPRSATITRKVARRGESTVYVDYLQNIRGKTVASVYSLRARPDATVSTPLRWDEVDEALDPRELTIRTVPARILAVGDLWAAGMRRPNSLAHLAAE